MKAAFTIWNNRISPVFDVAEQVLLLEADNNGSICQHTFTLPTPLLIDKLAFLQDKKIVSLVCGAISQPVQSAVEALGIQVYPFCSGDITTLIEVWHEGDLDKVTFSMPGCCGKRRGSGRGNGCNRRHVPQGKFTNRNRRQ